MSTIRLNRLSMCSGLIVFLSPAITDLEKFLLSFVFFYFVLFGHDRIFVKFYDSDYPQKPYDSQYTNSSFITKKLLGCLSQRAYFHVTLPTIVPTDRTI